MTNTEGFLYIVIIIELFAGFLGFILLSGLFALFNLLKNRPFNLFLLCVTMVSGWLYAMRGDAPMMLTVSLFFGVPVAVLVPFAIRPFRDEHMTPLSRIGACYLAVWIMAALFPWALVISGVSMMPFIFWHTPLSNAFVFGVAMLTEIGLAALILHVVGRRIIPS